MYVIKILVLLVIFPSVLSADGFTCNTNIQPIQKLYMRSGMIQRMDSEPRLVLKLLFFKMNRKNPVGNTAENGCFYFKCGLI